MVGGVNEATVVEMFQLYRKQYREDQHLIGDDDDRDIHRRYAYTREHKLVAIDYTLNTWERDPRTGQLEHISRYYAAKRLKVTRITLTSWVKKKKKILAQKRGSRRLQQLKAGRHPEMENKLNQEFEEARDIGRKISHSWFTR